MNETKWCEFKNVRLAYGGQTIFSKITLELEHGITLMLGRNGSGKSSIISAMEGLKGKTLPGLVKIDGYSVNRNPEFAFRNCSFLPERVIPLSSGKTLNWVMSYYSLRKFSFRLFQDLLQRFEAEHCLDVPVKSLSMGERQLISLSLCLSSYSSIFILDEPNANLDSERRFVLSEVIYSMKEKFNSTFLITTHILDDLIPIADKLLYISKNERSVSLIDLAKQPQFIEINVRSKINAFISEALGEGVIKEEKNGILKIRGLSLSSFLSTLSPNLLDSILYLQIFPDFYWEDNK